MKINYNFTQELKRAHRSSSESIRAQASPILLIFGFVSSPHELKPILKLKMNNMKNISKLVQMSSGELRRARRADELLSQLSCT